MEGSGDQTKQDQTIIDKISSGDQVAFEELFHGLYERLVHFAYRIIHDQDQAEDVVQEMFAKLWINRHKLNIEKSITAYTFSAVRNSCYNLIKHEKVKEAHKAATLHTAAPDHFITHSIDAQDLHIRIQQCISALPPERQKIFLLSREDGLKYHEIAEKLNISVKTVEAQMGKALRFMREKLRDYLVLVWAFGATFIKLFI
jgi:RNA polymerase sigma-70 factor (ECF subfamily)